MGTHYSVSQFTTSCFSSLVVCLKSSISTWTSQPLTLKKAFDCTETLLTQAACSKVYDGKPAEFGRLPQQVNRHLELLCVGEELGWVHRLGQSDLAVDCARMVHGVNNIAWKKGYTSYES